jgi:hypothetical protein
MEFMTALMSCLTAFVTIVTLGTATCLCYILALIVDCCRANSRATVTAAQEAELMQSYATMNQFNTEILATTNGKPEWEVEWEWRMLTAPTSPAQCDKIFFEAATFVLDCAKSYLPKIRTSNTSADAYIYKLPAKATQTGVVVVFPRGMTLTRPTQL